MPSSNEGHYRLGGFASSRRETLFSSQVIGEGARPLASCDDPRMAEDHRGEREQHQRQHHPGLSRCAKALRNSNPGQVDPRRRVLIAMRAAPQSDSGCRYR